VTADPRYAAGEKQMMLRYIRAIGGMAAIESAMTKARRKVNAVVLGECIHDIYRFVRPQGMSSKSPTISAELLREEIYYGGAPAIKGHIEWLCNDVHYGWSGRAHKKIRYVANETGQKLFEVTELGEEIGGPVMPDYTDDCNLVIVADFGHGYFKDSWITSEFKAVNVQTNSSNFGFNVFRKQLPCDYLVLDTREIQLAYHDRDTDPLILGFRLHNEIKKPVALTRGPHGAVIFHNEHAFECPAFAENIVDATGAGDAFFALTSVLMKIEADPMLTCFLGNVFAGLKTKIIGNKASVTKESLIKACAEILA
jgi:bifunctional ADP-heptose synthase (sugar kinase/adenylyltransferase)